MKIKLILLISALAFSISSNGKNARSIFSSGYGVEFETQAPSNVEDMMPTVQDASSKRDEPVKEKVSEAHKPKNDANSVDGMEYVSSKKDAPLKEDKPISHELENDVAMAENNIINQKKVAKRIEYSGLSYTIFKEDSSGSFYKIDPSIVFKTGDRISVEVVTNKSGTLIIGNIDPLDKSTLLGVQNIKAGEPIRFPKKGALKFVGPKGNERLVFALSGDVLPKNSSHNYENLVTQCTTSSTRSLVVDDTAGNEFQLINKDGSCIKNKKTSGTRSIIVDVSENSGFGVTPEKNLKAGQLLSLIVNLKHE